MATAQETPAGTGRSRGGQAGSWLRPLPAPTSCQRPQHLVQDTFAECCHKALGVSRCLSPWARNSPTRRLRDSGLSFLGAKARAATAVTTLWSKERGTPPPGVRPALPLRQMPTPWTHPCPGRRHRGGAGQGPPLRPGAGVPTVHLSRTSRLRPLGGPQLGPRTQKAYGFSPACRPCTAPPPPPGTLASPQSPPASPGAGGPRVSRWSRKERPTAPRMTRGLQGEASSSPRGGVLKSGLQIQGFSKGHQSGPGAPSQLLTLPASRQG